MLRRYRGGKIIKHRHPIHNLVKRIEDMTYPKDVVLKEEGTMEAARAKGRQPAGLGSPLNMWWYALLSVSRGSTNCWGLRTLKREEHVPPELKDKELAVWLARGLADQFESLHKKAVP